MQFGGELIFFDFKKKKVKNRRVVFLCDVSGSMDVCTLLILQFIHALQRIDRRTEISFFATDLFRGTAVFELNEFTSAAARLPKLISDCGLFSAHGCFAGFAPFKPDPRAVVNLAVCLCPDFARPARGG